MRAVKPPTPTAPGHGRKTWPRHPPGSRNRSGPLRKWRIRTGPRPQYQSNGRTSRPRRGLARGAGRGARMGNRTRGQGSGELVRRLGRLFRDGTVIGLSESELIDRFVRGRDEMAFEALLARHGPMVLGVCRQLLRDPNDVDDAFQAAFLVLVRRAGTLRRGDLLGNWLYGVAYRVALRARASSARRAARAPLGSEAVAA